MNIQGKIKVKTETQTFGSNGFKKRELVVTTDEQYPQDINIEFHQDKTDILNKYNVGDNVDVSINLRGKEWINPQGESKYFNTLVGWRISKVDVNNIEVNEPTVVQTEPVENEDDLLF